MSEEKITPGCHKDKFAASQGHHQYAEKTCKKCGHMFCWECCGATNVHEGGKHEPDFMLCPKCGHDYYEENE